jgi:hypothetical protein
MEAAHADQAEILHPFKVTSYVHACGKIVIPMTLNNTDPPSEEWKELEQKIKAFQEHVKHFNREINKRL